MSIRWEWLQRWEPILRHPGKDRQGACDGMKLDVNGNIWTTGPGGVLIITPEGKLLGSILLGQPTANLAWGNDGHTLYITSKDRLLRVKTKIKGAGF